MGGDELPRLGPLEEQVVHVLWDHGPSTVREIIDRLPTHPAYTTIATVLGNLARKGLVDSARDGRSVRWSSRMSRPERAAGLMHDALHAAGDREASILHFVESMSETDLALLRDYLDRRDEPGGRS